MLYKDLECEPYIRYDGTIYIRSCNPTAEGFYQVVDSEGEWALGINPVERTTFSTVSHAYDFLRSGGLPRKKHKRMHVPMF